MEEHLFRWDEVKWEKVTEKDERRTIEFVINNYNPKLSLPANASALASLVHVLRSFYWYAGNLELLLGWLVMYILLPPVRGFFKFIFYITFHERFLLLAVIPLVRNTFGFVAIFALDRSVISTGCTQTL